MPSLSHLENSSSLFTATIVAMLLHAIVIAGIHFEWQPKVKHTPMLEITLAKRNDRDVPIKAEFLAPVNQLGSGDSETSQALLTPYQSPFANNAAESQAREQASLKSSQTDRSLIQAESGPWWTATDVDLPLDIGDNEAPLDAESGDIATLEARLDNMLQRYAKLPRVKRLTSLSTQRAEDAAYVLAWQQQIESTGNRFYPQRAKELGIEGDVRLMVALYPNGHVKEVRLLQSSGHALLDSAAIGIVELAAPFPALPIEMAQHTDILEIIRTWQFRRDRLTSKLQ
jgi:protein TonB